MGKLRQGARHCPHQSPVLVCQPLLVLGFELVWGQRCRPALVALLGARDCLRWAEEAPLPSVLPFFPPFVLPVSKQPVRCCS